MKRLPILLVTVLVGCEGTSRSSSDVGDVVPVVPDRHPPVESAAEDPGPDFSYDEPGRLERVVGPEEAGPGTPQPAWPPPPTELPEEPLPPTI